MKKPSSQCLSLEASASKEAPKKAKKKMTKKRKLKKKQKVKSTASAQQQSEPPEAEEGPAEEDTSAAPAPEHPALRPQYPDTPDGFDPHVTRAVNRKRYTSRAWHAGAVEAKQQKLEGDAYYEKAREYSQRASEELERLWPTPAAAAQADAADPADID